MTALGVLQSKPVVFPLFSVAGDFDHQGARRARELYASCAHLGIPAQRVHLVLDPCVGKRKEAVSPFSLFCVLLSFFLTFLSYLSFYVSPIQPLPSLCCQSPPPPRSCSSYVVLSMSSQALLPFLRLLADGPRTEWPPDVVAQHVVTAVVAHGIDRVRRSVARLE